MDNRQPLNGIYVGTIAPKVYGMIDAHAPINSVATWPIQLTHVQIDATNKTEPIRFTDSKAAMSGLRFIEGENIGYSSTVDKGDFLVKLNSRMYNEENINYREFKELSQIKRDIRKLLNGRKRGELKDKKELYQLDDLEKQEKKLKAVMVDIYRKDVPSLIIAPTMDMEFAHIGGYEGEVIYQQNKETGKVFYKRDGRERYLIDGDALMFQTWNRQISDTEVAVIKNTLRLFPLFSYDPRRYRLVNSDKMKKDLRTWREPFARIVGHNDFDDNTKKIWLGFCMNPTFGFRPFDELCEHLPKFYKECEENNIPILAHCVPGGITMHDARYYKRRRNKLLEEKQKNNDTSMYRGSERVVSDVDLNNFYMNYGHPRNWIPVLKDYPDLRLCLAGFGGNGEWRQADWADNNSPLPTREWIRCIIKLAAKYKNVYVDISGLNIYDKKIRSGLQEMLKLMQDEGNDNFKHLKYKLIFGSGWYLTYLTDVSDGGTSINGWEDIRHSYSNYCREFKNLFYTADKEGKGMLWERVSLINPWNFYGLSQDRINKIHDELSSTGDTKLNRELLERMKGEFDGSDEDTVGLITYISDYNENDRYVNSQQWNENDKDLAPLEIEVVEPSQIVEVDQIKEMYWSYGKEFKRLKSEDAERNVWKSKYYDDLNFHVETKDGNDGKNVEITVENDDGQLIDLIGIVSRSNVIFEKVFKEYDSH